MKLEDLHDASFHGLRLDFGLDEVLLTFRVFRNQKPSQVVMRFEGFVDLRVPHNEPWGRSSAVNRVTRVLEEPGVRVEVELQSGDTIVVVAEAERLEEAMPTTE